MSLLAQMEHLSAFNYNSGTPKISIHVICILPLCAKPDAMGLSKQHSQTSNHRGIPMLSPPHHTPKRTMKKIIKAILPFVFSKTKKQEEESPHHSKKSMKKIDKASQFLCLKVKQHPDDEKCLWKKTILMGEKCQPLQFPGAIFYDSKGNRVSEPPMSPRASSLLLSPFASLPQINYAN